MDHAGETFPEIDVSTFSRRAAEQMGTKPKQWLVDSTGGHWLFKWMSQAPGRQHRGEDWAEKLAAEIGLAVGLPCATVELAYRDATPGVIIRDVRPKRSEFDLVHGNELLAAHIGGYPQQHRRNIAQYRIEHILVLLDAFHTSTDWTPQQQFGAYLAFDALIGNTDRHHENWAALFPLRGPRYKTLAPSFDHGTSLGCGITDKERSARLESSDVNYRPGGYGRRAKSHFGDARTLLEAVQVVATLRPGTAPVMQRVAQRADSPTVGALTDRIPAHRMTATAKRFCTEMVHANRTELLNLLKEIP